MSVTSPFSAVSVTLLRPAMPTMVAKAPLGMSVVSLYRLPPMVMAGAVAGPKIVIWNGMAVGCGLCAVAFLVVGL